MENELKHVGILGMKWGHRKARSVSSNTTSSTRLTSRQLRPHLIKTTTTTKIIKNPSKKEIQDFIKERKALRIKNLKATAIQIAAITALVGTMKVAEVIAWNTGKVISNG